MVKSFLRNLFRPKILLTAVLSVAAVSALGVGLLLANNPVDASACPGKDDDNNAFMRCGFTSASNFETKFNANVNAGGDLDEVYKHFGFTSGDMGRLKTEGKWGWAKNNGTIVLDDGRVVATNGASSGREKWGEQRHGFNVAGSSATYFWSYLQHSFAPGTTKIRVLVLMDKEDKYMQFAVMDACGNPTWGELPKFDCKKLTADKPEKFVGEEFTFKTQVDLKNATVKNYHYDFDDGKSIDTTNAEVKHSYTKGGNYKVTVTVTYIVNGVEVKEKLQIHCKTEVKVKEKKVIAKCDSLTPKLITGRKYSFKGIAKVENATLKSATFNYGDGSTAPGKIGDKDGNKIEVTGEHTYKEDLVGKVTITLTLTFDVKGSAQSDKCETELEFKKKPCVPKEGEDSECKILPKEECIPQKGEDANCVKLPDTGPAEILGAALGVSGLGAAGAYYRASRKNLRDLIKR